MLEAFLRLCSFSLLILSILFGDCSKAHAQGYRQLTKSDFQGKPDENDPFVSQVKLRIGYHSTIVKKGNTYRVTFQVFLDVNQKESWIKFAKIKSREALAEVLNHEQGHFKIGLLMQRELIERLNARKYTKHYKQEAATLFNRIADKYQAIQLRYDAETTHMMNRKQQAVWDANLNQAIQNNTLFGQ